MNEVYIFGLGNIGGYVGVRLTARYGKNIVGVDKNSELVELVRKEGFTLKTKRGIERSEINAIHVDEFKPDEAAAYIIATKQYDVAEAVQILPESNKGVLFLQNGYNDERDVFPDEKSTYGVLGITHIKLSLNHTQQLIPGTIYLGNFGRSPGETELTFGRHLQGAGLDTKIVDDLWPYFWSKLARNATSNSLCAISGKSLGELLRDKKTADAVVKLYTETLTVGEAHMRRGGKYKHEGMNGVNRNEFALFKRLAFLPVIGRGIREMAYQKFREVRTSMSEDIINNSQTEGDYINGFVVKTAEALGARAKLNKGVLELLQGIEEGRLEKDIAHIKGMC